MAAAGSKYLGAGAEITTDGIFRYSLWRHLASGERVCLFVGLNPSTATDTEDDNTIRREVDFCRQWGFDWYYKANIYAYRSTNPKVLTHISEPIGPKNGNVIRQLSNNADLIIAAWGSFKLSTQAQRLADRVLTDPKTRCLRQTKPGAPPWHPLYLPKTSRPLRWQPKD